MLRRVLIQPIIDLLRQGVTPKKLALAIALGFALGVTPVLGSTTLLCTAAAIALRLNLPAIQLVNGLAYPVQLAMLIPFLRAGAWLFRDPRFAVSLSQIVGLIRANVWNAIATLWTATMHALVAWLLFAGISTALMYILLVPILSRMSKRLRLAGEHRP
jgi:uncharacterized protein (DUF2062 family)